VLPNSAVEQTAGSHALAAAAHRERSATWDMSPNVDPVSRPPFVSSIDFVRQEAT